MFRYDNMTPGIFLRRPNRFVAHVCIAGREEICHVKNTGRCRELLTPHAAIWCQRHDDPHRKTAFSLIAVVKGDRLINMDSQVPNRVAMEYVTAGGLGFLPRTVRTEQSYGQSRFDLYVEDEDGRPGFVEVKGVTLEKDNVAYFPDAPTERGRKHLRHLAQAAREGYRAYLLFVVQMEDILRVEPNRKTDPEFAAALQEAADAGVEIRAVGCHVTPESIEAADPVEVKI